MQTSRNRIKGKKAILIVAGYVFLLLGIWVGVTKLLYINVHTPEVVKEYEEKLENEPNNSGFHFELGDIYLEMYRQKPNSGYLTKAKNQYQKAVNLSPNAIEYRYSLAETLNLLNEKQVLQEYEAILEIDPYEVQANFEMALHSISEKDYDPAIVYLEKCLVREPTSSNVFFALGEIFEKQKKWEEATKMYELVKKYDPTFNDIEDRIRFVSEQK